jgi:TP901 family phage tail tape measure protein
MAAAIFRFIGDPSSLKAAVASSSASLRGLQATAATSGSKTAASMAAIGKAAKVMAIGTAAAGVVIGAGLFKVGSDFNDAKNNIITATGASGEALKRLQADFKEVVKSVPTDMATASTAIGELNTRLGLTGKPLSDMSKQMIDLARVTGTDIKETIAGTTRVFGDWSIASKDQSKALDVLYKTTQSTGIGLTTLSESIVKFGAPMRQLGFSFEATSAILGKFEKEGVNSDLVMGALRRSLGKIAKEGKDPVKTFLEVTESIKNAGTAGEANMAAVELFGSKAGPDLAAAIREGRFEIADLIAELEGSGGAIDDSARRTEGFGEKWTRIKNNVLVGIEPLATKVFGGVLSLMDKLVPVVSTVSEAFSAFFAAFASGGDEITASGFAGTMEKIGNRLRKVWDQVVAAFKEIGPVLLKALKPVASTLTSKVVPALVSLGKWIVKNKPVLIGIATAIGVGLVAAFTSWAISAGSAAVATIAAVAPILLIGAAIAALVAGIIWAYQNVDWFRSAVQKVGDFLKNTVWPILQKVAGFIADVFVLHVKTLAWVWSNVVWPALKMVADFISQRVWPVIQGIANVLGIVAESVATHIGNIVGFVLAMPGRISRTISGLWNGISIGISIAKDWVRDRLNDLVAFVTGLPGRISSASSNLFDGFREAFRSALNWIIDKWNSLSFTLPKIEAFGHTIGGNTFSVPRIPRFAKGGIVDRPTIAMIGEGGAAEVVFPTDNPARGFALLAQAGVLSKSEQHSNGGRPAPNVMVTQNITAYNPRKALRDSNREAVWAWKTSGR